MIQSSESISHEPDLPDFTDPPLNEVVLSLQFASLPNLKSAHIGLFWERVRAEYPNVSEQGVIQSVFETFGIPSASPPFVLQIETLLSPPMPRYWFERPNSPDLLQLQNDRILHNWRQQSDNSRVYPRYESVKVSFEKELAVFQRWLSDEGIGELRPNQCEVTYINLIPLAAHRELEDVTPLWAGKLSENPPNQLERASIQATFLFSHGETPVGRVYVNFQPAFLQSDRSPVVRLEITARGRPRGETVADALSFFDLEREQVVKTFAAVTTNKMHELWGRTDAKR
jgi:uncharacterized protein (TIGR04255 family)